MRCVKDLAQADLCGTKGFSEKRTLAGEVLSPKKIFWRISRMKTNQQVNFLSFIACVKKIRKPAECVAKKN